MNDDTRMRSSTVDGHRPSKTRFESRPTLLDTDPSSRPPLTHRDHQPSSQIWLVFAFSLVCTTGQSSHSSGAAGKGSGGSARTRLLPLGADAAIVRLQSSGGRRPRHETRSVMDLPCSQSQKPPMLRQIIEQFHRIDARKVCSSAQTTVEIASPVDLTRPFWYRWR